MFLRLFRYKEMSMLLVDTFLQKMAVVNTATIRKDPLVVSGLGALNQAVKQGDKVYFAPSTMAMLAEKLAHYQDTLQEITAAVGSADLAAIYQRASQPWAGWIEFDKPVKVDTRAISAMFFYSPAMFVKTGRDGHQLYLIDHLGEIAEILERKTVEDSWTFASPYHTCRNCTREYGVFVPCQPCSRYLEIWGARIFPLSCIIAGQYLAALRYEEKTFSGVRRVPRQGNSKKEKRVTVSHIFKVIDANEIIIQVPPPQAEDRAKEIRGTWIVEGEVEYKEIRTRPFTRTYRHSRYVNVRGDTIKFPEGITRRQPMKKENVGKHVTKVRASNYE
jgi:hypothetical protein